MKHGALFLCTLVFVLSLTLLVSASTQVDHGVISIASDYEFTVANGVCSGSGTFDDPYVIEGWKIDAGDSRHGIRVHGTTRPFVIRNVTVSGASAAAISLSYARNANIEGCMFEANWAGVTLNFSTFVRIVRCTFEKNTDGIHFFFSDENQVLDCVFRTNDTALWLDSSDGNEIWGNLIQTSYMGVYLNLGSTCNSILRNAFVANVHNAYSDEPNFWNDDAGGNYWSNFAAVDANLDGVRDTPYTINQDGDQDSLPLVTHPLVPAAPSATCGS
jgi:parallel beta-helix repeat protein